MVVDAWPKHRFCARFFDLYLFSVCVGGIVGIAFLVFGVPALLEKSIANPQGLVAFAALVISLLGIGRWLRRVSRHAWTQAHFQGSRYRTLEKIRPRQNAGAAQAIMAIPPPKALTIHALDAGSRGQIGW